LNVREQGRSKDEVNIAKKNEDYKMSIYIF
jgi:glutamate formiminotransferase/formiminotetrahydrofolate cyclodeaminase